MVAIVPMPMAMLVVAAVLDAAMATPSTTPRERRRSGLGAEERGGAEDMEGSSGTGDGEEPRGEVMEQPMSTLGQPC
ncbi:hypothetical protein TUSST3_62920 [Streptomyces sp. TUS-ST3]|nr:hypothetical protein TUSST3_62920 [Streptomyces sp. TUS-ST3]